MELQDVVILIDDDKLFHQSWQLKANKMKINLRCFYTAEDFISQCSGVPKAASIFIDSDLGSGVSGEHISKKIHELGFENIWLCTGFTDLKISDFPWLKGIISKKPPF